MIWTLISEQLNKTLWPVDQSMIMLKLSLSMISNLFIISNHIMRIVSSFAKQLRPCNIIELNKDYETSWKFLNWLRVDDGALRSISRSQKWLDCKRYLYHQQLYRMRYYPHEILSMRSIIELNEHYQTSTKSLKLGITWWLYTEVHILCPKVVRL